ncbi:MAG: HU family DNA-binding protein [Calditrichaeota bacterium]|jgi:DNA-binding protein HU-beta|nr:HU family DNA-binding protein [Deltaproteobacteria bacterium]MBT4641585.1 HU family DNA-binding protein [Deltaproteobacteria bacterium]MBT7618711.1 HU family DNA-binding protein [Calditrichota bacterium]
MNKKDLIDKIAADVEVSKTAAGQGLDAVIKSIQGGIVGDGGVQMVGFGTFQTVKRAARNGRNPQTGKTIKIKAKKVVKFTVGKGLKDAVE